LSDIERKIGIAKYRGTDKYDSILSEVSVVYLYDNTEELILYGDYIREFRLKSLHPLNLLSICNATNLEKFIIGGFVFGGTPMATTISPITELLLPPNLQELDIRALHLKEVYLPDSITLAIVNSKTFVVNQHDFIRNNNKVLRYVKFE